MHTGAPQKGGRAAGSVAAALPAAQHPTAAAAAAGDAPSKYQGVIRLSTGNWAFKAPMVDGRDTLVPGFATERAAADGYDAVMRAHGCRVVNSPQLPGELQAVVGESAAQTLQRSEAALAAPQPAAAQKPSAPPPLPAPAAAPSALTGAATPAAAPSAAAATLRSPDAPRPPSAAAAPAAGAALSAAAAALRSPDAKRLFKGVHASEGARSFHAVALIGDGLQKRMGPFATDEAAARAYDDEMRLHKRRVVNFPTLPGEIQAVYGEMEHVTLRRHELNPNRVVEPVRRSWKRKPKAEAPQPSLPAPGTMLPSPPLPAAPAPGPPHQPASAPPQLAVAPPQPASAPPQPASAPPQQAASPASPPPPVKKEERLYKGVQKSSPNRYVATIRANNQKMPLGHFNTAKEAADAYDAHVRRLGSRVVNTPLLPGELQAVHGELDAVTIHRADSEAARTGALPPRTSRRSSGLPPPPLRMPPAAKRKAARSASERDSEEEEEEEEDDDSKGGGARAEPTAKRARLADLMVPPQPPAPQLPLAIMPPAAVQGRQLAPPASPAADAAAMLVAAAGEAELVAFLRGITPPLADIERVAAAAAASGLQLRHLRDAVVSSPVTAHPHQGATNLHLVADILGIHRGADKVALIMALQRAR